MRHTLSDSTYRAIASCEEQYPYLAAALDAMPVVESDRVPTASCSARGTIYVSVGFLATLDRAAAGGLIAHEVWHYLAEHFSRMTSMSQAERNIRADAEINDDLHALPDGAVYPSTLGHPDHLTAEEYTVPEHMIRTLCVYAGSASDGVDREWETDTDAVPVPESVRDEVAREIARYGRCGEGAKRWAESRLHVALPPLRVRMRAAARAAGAVPHEPEPSYAVPSRRHRSGIVVPGRVRDMRSAAVVLDTSGSMTEDGGWLLGVLYSVARVYGEPVWVAGDTGIRSRGRKPPKEFVGGGGTDMASIVRQIDDEGHAVIVVATDGETPWHGPGEVRTPCVAVLTSEDGAGKCPPHIPHVVAVQKDSAA